MKFLDFSLAQTTNDPTVTLVQHTIVRNILKKRVEHFGQLYRPVWISGRCISLMDRSCEITLNAFLSLSLSLSVTLSLFFKFVANGRLIRGPRNAYIMYNYRFDFLWNTCYFAAYICMWLCIGDQAISVVRFFLYYSPYI